MHQVVTASETLREQLRTVICGHVDHGKSTLVGRLIHETGSLADGKLDAIKAMCERRGMPFEWAFLMDAFQAERDQGITIDTSQIWLRTPRRDYVIIDAPGHREFIKNMITGASSADAALVLIDASHGVQQQSRLHGFLLNLLGIKQIVVLVNKMDLIEYSQRKFEAIRDEYSGYLQSIGATADAVIPVSARDGDNLTSASTQMKWYRGPSVMDVLSSFRPTRRATELPLRLPIQDVYKFDDRRILVGRIESGRLKVGDRLLFSPSNKISRVASIESWHTAAAPTEAEAGQSVGITLDDQLFVERGELASHPDHAPLETDGVPRPPVLAGAAASEEGRRVSPAHRDPRCAGHGRSCRTRLRCRGSVDPQRRRDRPSRRRRCHPAHPRHAGCRRGQVIRAHRPLRADRRNAHSRRRPHRHGRLSQSAGDPRRAVGKPADREAPHHVGAAGRTRTATRAACCGSPACQAPASRRWPWRWSRDCS